VIAYFRLFGRDGDISRIDLICRLTKSTGILPPPPPPAAASSSNAASSSAAASPPPGAFSYADRSFKYPTDDEKLFDRFPLPPDLIRNVVGCLISDDVYRQSSAFPNIDHRSTRLSRQASMLYVILYFDPVLLRDERAKMREIVDKYFHDNWVVHVYAGVTADLGLEWDRFAAARSALGNVLSPDGVRRMHVGNAKLIGQCMAELRAYLTMGILTDAFVLDNRHDLLNCLRRCNIAIRWRVLHRRTSDPAYRAIVCVAPDRVTTDPRLEADFAINDTHVVSLILLTSQLELQLKSIFRDLLGRRGSIWAVCRSRACGIMGDLADYYRGDRTLARVSRHEGLIQWFGSMAGEIGDLAYDGDAHFTVTGRRIQLCVRALEEVEAYDMVDRDVQVKAFLGESRDLLLQMARAVGVTEDVCEDIRWISDMSYGIESMRSYVQIVHSRISKDPSNVSLLQGFFAKLSSSLDGSVERLRQLGSPEVDRVTGYYSSRLVSFVRDVLGIVPVSVFAILVQMSDILERRLQRLPSRVQGDKLIAYAQLGERYKLNMMAHEISIFADGEREA
jgi:WASH complex subunit strumpellin